MENIKFKPSMLTIHFYIYFLALLKRINLMFQIKNINVFKKKNMLYA